MKTHHHLRSFLLAYEWFAHATGSESLDSSQTLLLAATQNYRHLSYHLALLSHAIEHFLRPLDAVDDELVFTRYLLQICHCVLPLDFECLDLTSESTSILKHIRLQDPRFTQLSFFSQFNILEPRDFKS